MGEKQEQELELFICKLRNKILKIGNQAVKEAQIEALKKGVPNVYYLNGTVFYQLPNGEITSKKPDIFK